MGCGSLTRGSGRFSRPFTQHVRPNHPKPCSRTAKRTKPFVERLKSEIVIYVATRVWSCALRESTRWTFDRNRGSSPSSENRVGGVGGRHRAGASGQPCTCGTYKIDRRQNRSVDIYERNVGVVTSRSMSHFRTYTKVRHLHETKEIYFVVDLFCRHVHDDKIDHRQNRSTTK